MPIISLNCNYTFPEICHAAKILYSLYLSEYNDMPHYISDVNGVSNFRHTDCKKLGSTLGNLWLNIAENVLSHNCDLVDFMFAQFYRFDSKSWNRPKLSSMTTEESINKYNLYIPESSKAIKLGIVLNKNKFRRHLSDLCLVKHSTCLKDKTLIDLGDFILRTEIMPIFTKWLIARAYNIEIFYNSLTTLQHESIIYNMARNLNQYELLQFQSFIKDGSPLKEAFVDDYNNFIERASALRQTWK